MTKLLYTTKEDKALVALALLNEGVKARTKMLNRGFRVCFTGSWETVARVLNENGFRTAGGEFTRFSFNDINGEVFVTYKVF